MPNKTKQILEMVHTSFCMGVPYPKRYVAIQWENALGNPWCVFDTKLCQVVHYCKNKKDADRAIKIMCCG